MTFMASKLASKVIKMIYTFPEIPRISEINYEKFVSDNILNQYLFCKHLFIGGISSVF